MKKNLFLVALSVCMLTASANVFAGEASEQDFLGDIQGSYVGLFPVFRDDQNDAVWEEKLSEYAGVDKENAEAVKDAFLSMYESDIHGEEAQKKAEEEPGWFMFDCAFAGGVETMTFDGNVFSGVDAEGNEVFNHTYEYYGAVKKNFDPMTEMYMAGVSEEDWPVLYIYEGDGPEDEFKYFAFADDTPAETYHLEFRYGSDPEELAKYFTGAYGYWMVSAIYKDCDDEMMENCIDLFVEENADSIKAIAGSLSGAEEQNAEVYEISPAEELMAVFAGGSGTAEDPWEIETPEQLLAINDKLDASYVLTADIDLSEYENWPMIGAYVMDQESESGEDPIPEMTFTGTFDGAGHTISSLKIDATEDYDHMFGVGLFACVGHGGTVKDLVVSGMDVKGMMLVGGVVGYAYECTVDNVDITSADPENQKNSVESTMVMAGGVIGGLTCSECVNCDVEYVDIVVAPGGNCGVLGGGFSKPVLKNCTVKNSTVKGEMGEVPMFGMTQGAWIGGLTGCVNLGEYDPADWYVEGCSVENVEIEVDGTGSHVGGLTGSGGTELQDETAGRMRITGCELKDVSIVVGDQITCVGGIIGGGLSEGEPPHSFIIDGCKTSNVSITTDAEDLEEAQTGLLVGQSRYCQFVAEDGTIIDITQRDIPADSINSTVDVKILSMEGTEPEDAALVGQVVEDNGILPAIAGENGTTYENFFDVTLAEENYDLWYDCTAAIVGESAAEGTVAFMQGYINSDRYGEEAISYYTENPDAQTMFDCFYINGLKLVTFNPDNTITIQLEDGTTETHTYEYLGSYNVGEGETMVYMGQEISVAFPCDVYKSTDEAGEFNYFFLRDDTMEETGHIEFRYGKDLEELQGYFTGPYAYWLTAGFDVDADEETLKSTVELFVLENMDYSSHSEEAVAQLSDFIGTWNADLSAFGEAYADTELYFTIDENGHGITMMNGEQTTDFEAYAFDNGEKGDGAGIYIAYSNLEYEAEAAAYTLKTNDAGETVLTLYAEDGVISYKKAS